MNTILGLIAVGLFAYAGVNLYRLSPKSSVLTAFITSGTGFFILGLVLGPKITGLLQTKSLYELDVVVNLGVGWVGLLIGLQFDSINLRRISTRTYLGAGTESALTMVITAAGLWAAASLSNAVQPAWLTAVVLATMASTSSPTVSTQIIFDLRSRGPVTEAIRQFTSIDSLLAIVVMGIVLCFSPLHQNSNILVQSSWIWLAITIGAGLILGALSHLLTLYRYTDNQLFVITLGLVVFIGGAAHYLLISPLFINFIVGLVLANRSPQHYKIMDSLLRMEKPLYLILLIIAGAMWSLPPLSLLALVPSFVILRLIAKLLGGVLGSSLVNLRTKSPFGLGPGLLPHGGMALVIALHVKQFFPGPLGDLALTACIASMIISTLISPWALKSLLQQEGELR